MRPSPYVQAVPIEATDAVTEKHSILQSTSGRAGTGVGRRQ